MKFKPAKQYTATLATAKARELCPKAFAKYAHDSVAHERCQILVEVRHPPQRDDEPALLQTLLVASGPGWLEALESFYEWVGEYGAEYGAKLPEEKPAAAAPSPEYAIPPDIRLDSCPACVPEPSKPTTQGG
jgi:hypothetical protein